MERNLDLVRQILLSVEADQGPMMYQSDSEVIEGFEAYSRQEFEHHLYLLIEAGFIDGKGQWTFGNTYYATWRSLTWMGHDYLASVRDEGVWAKVQEGLGPRMASCSLEVVQAFAVSVVKGSLGL